MPNDTVALNDLASAMWEMEPRRLSAFLASVANSTLIPVELPDEVLIPVELPDEVEENKEKEAAVANVIRRGVAIIPIKGMLMASVPRWFSWFGINATSYGDIRSMIGAAVMNEDVERIHLEIDSPGGTVAGVHETAQEIFKARGSKEVSAHINDLGASAAYHLAAQAQTITAGVNAEVGSIGVFSVYVDSSKAAADEGIKVHVIRSGEHKGMGIPGDKITKEQLASQQAVVDGMAKNFVSAVAKGRGKKVAEIRKLATGETWIAEAAVKNGLVDSLTGSDKKNNSKTKGSKMGINDGDVTQEEHIDVDKIASDAVTKAKAEDRERLSAMREAYPDHLEFAIDQYAKDASLIEAKAAFADVLVGELKEARKAKPETVEVDGAPALAHTEGGEQGAGGFMDQAAALAKEKGISKTDAIQQLRRSDPEGFAAHQAAVRQGK